MASVIHLRVTHTRLPVFVVHQLFDLQLVGVFQLFQLFIVSTSGLVNILLQLPHLRLRIASRLLQFVCCSLGLKLQLVLEARNLLKRRHK